jgi:hypothetical protein
VYLQFYCNQLSTCSTSSNKILEFSVECKSRFRLKLCILKKDYSRSRYFSVTYHVLRYVVAHMITIQAIEIKLIRAHQRSWQVNETVVGEWCQSLPLTFTTTSLRITSCSAEFQAETP